MQNKCGERNVQAAINAPNRYQSSLTYQGFNEARS